MPIDIRLISLRDFVRTDMVGTLDFEITKAALTEIVKASSECGVPNLLIDARMAIAVEVSASDIHELVMHLLSLGIDPTYRIAILNDPKDQIDRGKLFEEDARERGIDAAVFRDFEAALTWLCRLPSGTRR
jgi:hypothetical protein